MKKMLTLIVLICFSILCFIIGHKHGYNSHETQTNKKVEEFLKNQKTQRLKKPNLKKCV